MRSQKAAEKAGNEVKIYRIGNLHWVRMSLFKNRNIHMHIHIYIYIHSHMYTCTPSMGKERNGKLLQSTHVSHNPKRDVLFTEEHNVEKEIR